MGMARGVTARVVLAVIMSSDLALLLPIAEPRLSESKLVGPRSRSLSRT